MVCFAQRCRVFGETEAGETGFHVKASGCSEDRRLLGTGWGGLAALGRVRRATGSMCCLQPASASVWRWALAPSEPPVPLPMETHPVPLPHLCKLPGQTTPSQRVPPDFPAAEDPPSARSIPCPLP